MYQVEGYAFESKEAAKEAKKEAEGIKMMRNSMNLDDAAVALQLYKKLIANDLLHTVIGYSFLKELQISLRMSPQISSEDIPVIPVYDRGEEEQRAKVREEELAKQQKKEAKVQKTLKRAKFYRKGFFVSSFFSIVFALGIIGMFVIAYVSGNSMNIFNYENELIDRYEGWEQELTERERELDVREEEVERREQLLHQHMQ